ncbi:glycosyltransferase [Nocardioides panzhihuensis]|uniref:Glycosyltransferase involved in cell wall biosynthesis n=1 Tax=Nocardioides panzhihuensis TaxID=860243 RepID=A0A7Z0DJ66_9ACTN|nr:glycosyltransferase [Nocardioides panzhihuensis]NYI76318.1 glycosyltransferase involved in cell wall biosynthesis [Nocardioides panzhihuensis]
MPSTLLSFPHYASNPYLTMLTVAPRAAGWDVVDGIRTLHRLELRAGHLASGDVLHVHWTSPVTSGCQNADEAWAKAARFEDVLTGVRSRGVDVIWTVHNSIAHEADYMDVELAVAKMLARHATRIIRLNPATIEETAAYYALPPEKVVELPHSSYLGVYPDGGDDVASRERIGVPQGVPTVGFIGQIRAYKGLDVLCRAVKIAARTVPDLTFVVAGKVVPAEDHQTVEAMLSSPNVVKRLEFVETADYSDWLRSSDVVALPYRRILNSGSLLAAGTFGRTALIPEGTPIARQFAEQPWVVTYAPEPDEPAALAAAILEALEGQEERRRAAHEYTRAYTPYDMSRDYLRLLEGLAGVVELAA